LIRIAGESGAVKKTIKKGEWIMKIMKSGLGKFFFDDKIVYASKQYRFIRPDNSGGWLPSELSYAEAMAFAEIWYPGAKVVEGWRQTEAFNNRN
jgi:hypothetical protein